MFEKILHRPALAIVISIILLFLGMLGIVSLPMSQFPSIAPPTVQVAIACPLTEKGFQQPAFVDMGGSD